MLINTWQFARGYVTVEVTGFAIERFLNMAAFHGVYLWEVARTGSGIQMNVSIPGFKMLKNCARKTKSKVRIINRKGWPFIAFRYRRRKVLWGGVIFFIAALYALSTFIWRIEVTGQEQLDREEILTFCESYGLRVGAFKYRINHRQLQRDLQIRFPEIGWADVHTKGTRTTVTVSETIPKQEIIDKETPCHIVASKDGLITGIVTGAGKPLVRASDVVKQGEMLVSGALEYQSDKYGLSVNYVHAYAEVWAKRYTPVVFTVPYTYTEKRYTGRSKNNYELLFLFGGGKRFSLPALWPLGGSASFESYDKITNRFQPGVESDYPFPFIWIRNRYDEFVPETRTRGLEEAMATAERMLTGRIIREFDFSADIVDKEMKFIDTTEGLHVEALITTIERIDAAVPINTRQEPGPLPDDAVETFEPVE
jgi:similar to stage IV sporulation protein